MREHKIEDSEAERELISKDIVNEANKPCQENKATKESRKLSHEEIMERCEEIKEKRGKIAKELKEIAKQEKAIVMRRRRRQIEEEARATIDNRSRSYPHLVNRHHLFTMTKIRDDTAVICLRQQLTT